MACTDLLGMDRAWGLTDPAGLSVEAVRPIRDDIRQRVRQLLSELDAA